MINVNLCAYHKRVKNESILTDDDINSCLLCTCNICCNPRCYCECNNSIIAHKHPSGAVTLSDEDLRAFETKDLIEVKE